MTEVVGIKGAKAMRRDLKKAGFDLAELREPHMSAARTVATAAKPMTPHRSGALAQSVRPGATRTAGVIRAGKKTVPYANPIHWGWYERKIRSQPWLSLAAQRTEPTWLPAFIKAMNEAIENMNENYAKGL